MSNIYKGEFQDYEGNVVYPHTTADVVYTTDGKTVQSKLNQLGEGLDGVTGRTDSPEVSDSNILASSKAVNTIFNNLKSDDLEFKFGKDGDGNYGYYGADGSLVPFKSCEFVRGSFSCNGKTEIELGFEPDVVVVYLPGSNGWSFSIAHKSDYPNYSVAGVSSTTNSGSISLSSNGFSFTKGSYGTYYTGTYYYIAAKG